MKCERTESTDRCTQLKKQWIVITCTLVLFYILDIGFVCVQEL